MSFMDKAKEAAEKFKDSDNEQVNKAKDKINEYTGGGDDDKRQRRQISLNHTVIKGGQTPSLYYIMTELLFVIFDKIQVVYLGHKCNLLPLAHQFLHIPL